MRKGFTRIEIIISIIIVFIIGIMATIIVLGVKKSMQKDRDKILLDNYANKVMYAKESFMKKNDNNLPKYCKIMDNKIFLDENNNNIYDSNELLCSVNCEDDSCIRYFITYKDIDDKDIKCNNIIISENNLEISDCYIKDKLIRNYKYTYNIPENSVE